LQITGSSGSLVGERHASSLADAEVGTELAVLR
jgi:hypothetical protein